MVAVTSLKQHLKFHPGIWWKQIPHVLLVEMPAKQVNYLTFDPLIFLNPLLI